jgi:putative acetyltransferase
MLIGVSMEIRKIKNSEISTIVDLWYETSVVAHNFISSDYWKKNKESMAKIYIPNSETYVAIENDEIIGFVSMAENYLAAIFVNNKNQGKGVGKKLLNFVKDRREIIQLKAYKKNKKTVEFYKRQNFKILSESIEETTGEYECFMEWNKNM